MVVRKKKCYHYNIKIHINLFTEITCDITLLSRKTLVVQFTTKIGSLKKHIVNF